MPAPLNERIFVALDVPTAMEATILASRVASTGVGFKLGPHFILDAGFSTFVSGLCGLDNSRFIDLKHLDIPATVTAAISQAARGRFNYATVHADRNALTAAVNAAKDSILNVLAVLVLTSDPDDSQFMSRLDVALKVGCQGVICPADKLVQVRKLVPENFLLVTPGIRPLGWQNDDHVHYGTPAQAIADGADFLVIGRPIVEASDPVAAICRIIGQMR